MLKRCEGSGAIGTVLKVSRTLNVVMRVDSIRKNIPCLFDIIKM